MAGVMALARCSQQVCPSCGAPRSMPLSTKWRCPRGHEAICRLRPARVSCAGPEARAMWPGELRAPAEVYFVL